MQKVTTKIDPKKMQTLRDLIATHKTIRYGTLLPNAYQTVENHTNRMLALAPVIANATGVNYDHNALNALILAHDLSELGMQKDITVFEQLHEKGAKARKEKLEKEATVTLAKKYGNWLKDLLDEYEQQNSEIAKFVKWLDRYESNRHMIEITAYSELRHQTDRTYIPLFSNSKRLIESTHKIPPLKDFTATHLEQELREIFTRNKQKDRYYELRTLLYQEAN